MIIYRGGMSQLRAQITLGTATWNPLLFDFFLYVTEASELSAHCFPRHRLELLGYLAAQTHATASDGLICLCCPDFFGISVLLFGCAFRCLLACSSVHFLFSLFVCLFVSMAHASFILRSRFFTQSISEPILIE